MMRKQEDEQVIIDEPIEGAAVLIQRLSRDLKQSARLLGRKQARYLVDAYYQMQHYRIATQGQLRSIRQSNATLLPKNLDNVVEANGPPADLPSGIGKRVLYPEPAGVLDWVFQTLEYLEHDIKLSLDEFTKQYRVGLWLHSITGIGPVITAGLLANLRAEGTFAAGRFWNFAGLNPDIKWKKGEKRPWNARLKTLCAFKIGESFVKFQNNPNDHYGQHYAKRKRCETQRNAHGDFAAQAAKVLAEVNIGKETEAYLWYAGCLPALAVQNLAKVEQGKRAAALKKLTKAPGTYPGMLPPAHIHARARRYAVKLFLSHLQHVMHVDWYGTDPPANWVFVHADPPHDLSHYVPPPNLPLLEKGKSLRELAE